MFIFPRSDLVGFIRPLGIDHHLAWSAAWIIISGWLKNETALLPLAVANWCFLCCVFWFEHFFSHHISFINPEYAHPVIYIYDKMFDRVVSQAAQLTVIAGLFTMYVAYFGSAKVLWRNLPSFGIPRRLDVHIFRLGIWILSAYLSYLYVPFIRLIPSIAQMVQPIGFPLFWWILYSMENGKSQPNQEAILIFFILYPLAWVKLILTGLLTPLLLYFIYFIILEFWQSRKIPLVKILSALILVSLIYPLMPIIRSHIWSAVNQTSLVEKLQERARLIGKVFIFNKKLAEGCNACDLSSFQRQQLYNFRGLVQRISHISVLTVVVEATPQEVPFLNGRVLSTTDDEHGAAPALAR